MVFNIEYTRTQLKFSEYMLCILQHPSETQILPKKTNGNLRSLENMEVSVRRMVMAMASLSAMHLGGKKRASQEMAR